ncbi:hypothetical protein [Streptomyces sp. NPDC001100]
MTSSAVRPDGHPLRLLCESLQSRLDELSVELTDDIRRELPSYAAMPLAEQRRTVRVRLGYVLRGLALDVEPTAEDLLEVQTASRRRAYYGLPVQDVLATFHLVSRHSVLFAPHMRVDHPPDPAPGVRDELVTRVRAYCRKPRKSGRWVHI